MHPHAELVIKLYTCLDAKDHSGMASCYHPQATFEDIAFALRGQRQIHAMWHMIALTDLRATFTVMHADDQSATAELVDDYTFHEKEGDPGRRVHNVIRSTFHFRDGFIVKHEDRCNALTWGIQALGPVKGLGSFLIPAIRKKKADEKLKAFEERHAEYA